MIPKENWKGLAQTSLTEPQGILQYTFLFLDSRYLFGKILLWSQNNACEPPLPFGLLRSCPSRLSDVLYRESILLFAHRMSRVHFHLTPEGNHCLSDRHLQTQNKRLSDTFPHNLHPKYR